MTIIRAIRNAIFDLLIISLLIVSLVWCCLLAWGAYCQHRSTISVSAHVFDDMRNAINNDLYVDYPELKSNIEKEIDRLKIAEENLYDANSSSFQYQFVSLIILSIGMSVLAIMYKNHKNILFENNKLKTRAENISHILAPFVRSQDKGFVIATKYAMVYTACNFQVNFNNTHNSTYRLISYYLDDIWMHLQNVEKNREGLRFEPGIYNFILDIAYEVDNAIVTIVDSSNNTNKFYLSHIRETSSNCLNHLTENYENIHEEYDENWKLLTGIEKTPEIE